MDERDESLRVVQQVIAALTNLEIPYALGGSWASSLLGKMRFTHDADLTAEPFPGKEPAFCGSFGEDYYLSAAAVQQAVRQRSTFNIIHTPSGFKVDVFVRKDRLFEESVMQRRQARALPSAPEQPIQVVSPEDLILLKLEWYRLGGEASENQWNDVLGILEVQAGQLDFAYLDHWARELRVDDLLAHACHESTP